MGTHDVVGRKKTRSKASTDEWQDSDGGAYTRVVGERGGAERSGAGL